MFSMAGKCLLHVTKFLAFLFRKIVPNVLFTSNYLPNFNILYLEKYLWIKLQRTVILRQSCKLVIEKSEILLMGKSWNLGQPNMRNPEIDQSVVEQVH